MLKHDNRGKLCFEDIESYIVYEIIYLNLRIPSVIDGNFYNWKLFLHTYMIMNGIYVNRELVIVET